jgi:hypothetical protein
MSGCSLPSNRSAESVIPGDFPIENQMNPFAPRFAFHRDDQKNMNKATLHSVVVATPIEEIDL